MKMILLIMGTAGSGKTTVGKEVAQALSWSFHDADEFHPLANKEKMSKGIPLDDEDRNPLLVAMRAKMCESLSSGEQSVFSCSALKFLF